jgi:hypothetical protein
VTDRISDALTPAFNLADYHKLFPTILEGKYGNRFILGFQAIERRYREIRSGDRLLTAEDVLAIFDRSLPFVDDWTKPDRAQLEDRMSGNTVALLTAKLRGRHSLEVLKAILDGFRELSLTSLVLHHVYPESFSICSHHIASLLFVVGHHSAGTVAAYYLEYCSELERWAHKFNLTVAQAECALWTWYRLANYGEPSERRKHRRLFEQDQWIAERRATRACESLAATDKLRFARFCLDSDPTLAAIIAWREFEIRLREVFVQGSDQLRTSELINRLPPLEKGECMALWKKRNLVMHRDVEAMRQEAEQVVRGVEGFHSRHLRKRAHSRDR